MKVLTRLKQIFVPINQPKNFPRFYSIPETGPVNAPRIACNDPQPKKVAPSIRRRRRRVIPRPIKYFREQKAIFYQRCAETRDMLIRACKRALQWLIWCYLTLLTLEVCTWVSVANPAELPL